MDESGVNEVVKTPLEVVTVPYKSLSGTAANVQDSSDAAYCISEPIQVTPGDTLMLSCSGGYYSSQYAFYNAAGTLVANKKAGEGGHAVEGNSLRDHEVVVPDGAVALRLSWNSNVIQGAASKVEYVLNGKKLTVYADRESELSGKGMMLEFERASNLVLKVNGATADNTDASYCVSDSIKINPNAWYKITASAGYGNAYYCIYDTDGNVLSYGQAPGGKSACIVNKMIYTPSAAKTIRISCSTSVSAAAIMECTEVFPKIVNAKPWPNKFMTISYSHIGVAPINTIETYLSAAHFGFNVCKGDIQPTNDGELVMCHDNGFTFDSNGRIIEFDAANCTKIRTLTHAQCMAYEYAGKSTATEMNHHATVADIDGYLDVCRQYGMIAFITVREEYIDVVVPKLLERLVANNMLEHAIINSYSVETLTHVRMLNDTVPLSFVRSTNENINNVRIDMFAQFAPAAVTLVSTESNMRTYVDGLKDVLDYARSNGVAVMYAQPLTMTDVTYLRNSGIAGAQIGRPVIPYNYSQTRFSVALSGGAATLKEPLNMTSIEADVAVSGNAVKVSNIRDAGSERGFADRVQEYWMNRFPSRITANSTSGKNVTAAWKNNAVEITVQDITVDDTIDVMVEV